MDSNPQDFKARLDQIEETCIHAAGWLHMAAQDPYVAHQWREHLAQLEQGMARAALNAQEIKLALGLPLMFDVPGLHKEHS